MDRQNLALARSVLKALCFIVVCISAITITDIIAECNLRIEAVKNGFIQVDGYRLIKFEHYLEIKRLEKQND